MGKKVQNESFTPYPGFGAKLKKIKKNWLTLTFVGKGKKKLTQIKERFKNQVIGILNNWPNKPKSVRTNRVKMEK